MRKLILRAALLLLPTLVLAGWALWLPLSSDRDPGMRIRLLGYDPRDLLRGHYLSARLDIHGLPPRRYGPDDCVCLVPRPEQPDRPGFTPLPSCQAEVLKSCPLPLADPGREVRLYQAKEKAEELDAMLAQGRWIVSVDVRFDGRGGIALRDMRAAGIVEPPKNP